MANKTVYLEALATFSTPATAREVHEKAKEIFGDQVRGESISARQSLVRYVALGRARKVGTKFVIVADALDETAQLNARLRMAEALIERLKQRIAELEDMITKT
jgi:hypothetical protein